MEVTSLTVYNHPFVVFNDVSAWTVTCLLSQSR